MDKQREASSIQQGKQKCGITKHASSLYMSTHYTYLYFMSGYQVCGPKEQTSCNVKVTPKYSYNEKDSFPRTWKTGTPSNAFLGSPAFARACGQDMKRLKKTWSTCFSLNLQIVQTWNILQSNALEEDNQQSQLTSRAFFICCGSGRNRNAMPSAFSS